MNPLAILMMTSTALSSPPAVELPVLATPAVFDTANTNTLATASFAVSTGDFLVVFTFSRDGDASTHDSLTAAGFTCAFTQRGTVHAALTNTVRATCWSGTVSAGGSGTITLTSSAAQFQQAMVVLKVPNGNTFDQAATGQNAAGTTLNAPFGATPNAGALSIGAIAQDGTGGTFALAGHAAVADTAGTSSSLKWAVFAKLGTPPDPLAFSGLQADVPHAAAGLTVT